MSQKSSKITKSQKSYPAEFREKAVKLVTELGYSLDQVAEKLGCSKESARRWKDAVKPKLDPDTALRMELEENENKRLKKEVARLKMENEILKKRRRTSPKRRCKSEVRLDRRTQNHLPHHRPVWCPESFHERILRLAKT